MWAVVVCRPEPTMSLRKGTSHTQPFSHVSVVFVGCDGPSPWQLAIVQARWLWTVFRGHAFGGQA